jgi:hypothetical protein
MSGASIHHVMGIATLHPSYAGLSDLREKRNLLSRINLIFPVQP